MDVLTIVIYDKGGCLSSRGRNDVIWARWRAYEPGNRPPPINPLLIRGGEGAVAPGVVLNEQIKTVRIIRTMATSSCS